ncbi:MAG: 6-bladed beta-propeller, partial [Tannerellaceae bacterium]
MKKTCIYGFAFAALLASCTTTVKQEPLQLINVQQTYPDKEVKLSELAKVTYVQPKTEGSDYLVKSSPTDITLNSILIVERENGDVMLFDRNGTPVSKFNKQGQGPEEYIDIFKALYDEKKKEVYIGDKQK